MTAHTRLDPPLVESIRKALTGNALPGETKGLSGDAEREARRPAAKPDTKTDVARAALRKAQPISLADLPNAEEFAVVITRRGTNGTHEPVAVVEDEALVERAIRRAA